MTRHLATLSTFIRFLNEKKTQYYFTLWELHNIAHFIIMWGGTYLKQKTFYIFCPHLCALYDGLINHYNCKLATGLAQKQYFTIAF